MGPFIAKIKRIRTEEPEKIPQGEWAFLREWESPIVEDKVEVLSERGKGDARVCLFHPNNVCIWIQS